MRQQALASADKAFEGARGVVDTLSDVQKNEDAIRDQAALRAFNSNMTRYLTPEMLAEAQKSGALYEGTSEGMLPANIAERVENRGKALLQEQNAKEDRKFTIDARNRGEATRVNSEALNGILSGVGAHPTAEISDSYAKALREKAVGLNTPDGVNKVNTTIAARNKAAATRILAELANEKPYKNGVRTALVAKEKELREGYSTELAAELRSQANASRDYGNVFTQIAEAPPTAVESDEDLMGDLEDKSLTDMYKKNSRKVNFKAAGGWKENGITYDKFEVPADITVGGFVNSGEDYIKKQKGKGSSATPSTATGPGQLTATLVKEIGERALGPDWREKNFGDPAVHRQLLETAYEYKKEQTLKTAESGRKYDPSIILKGWEGLEKLPDFLSHVDTPEKLRKLSFADVERALLATESNGHVKGTTFAEYLKAGRDARVTALPKAEDHKSELGTIKTTFSGANTALHTGKLADADIKAIDGKNRIQLGEWGAKQVGEGLTPNQFTDNITRFKGKEAFKDIPEHVIALAIQKHVTPRALGGWGTLKLGAIFGHGSGRYKPDDALIDATLRDYISGGTVKRAEQVTGQQTQIQQVDAAFTEATEAKDALKAVRKEANESGRANDYAAQIKTAAEKYRQRVTVYNERRNALLERAGAAVSRDEAAPPTTPATTATSTSRATSDLALNRPPVASAPTPAPKSRAVVTLDQVATAARIAANEAADTPEAIKAKKDAYAARQEKEKNAEATRKAEEEKQEKAQADAAQARKEAEQQAILDRRAEYERKKEAEKAKKSLNASASK
jgi:hypothetical protein